MKFMFDVESLGSGSKAISDGHGVFSPSPDTANNVPDSNTDIMMEMVMVM